MKDLRELADEALATLSDRDLAETLLAAGRRQRDLNRDVLLNSDRLHALSLEVTRRQVVRLSAAPTKRARKAVRRG